MRETRFRKIEKNKCAGYAVRWGEKSFVRKTGKFEVFERGSIKFPEDGVFLYVGHDSQKFPLATSKSKSLRLFEDKIGIRFEADLPEHRQDIRELIEKNIICGSSVGFYCKQDSYNGRTRYIQRAELDEISLASRPEYSNTPVFLREKSQKYNWAKLLWEY